MFLHQILYNTSTTTEISKKIIPLSINIHIHVYKRTPHYIQEVEDYFFDCIHCYTFSYRNILQMVSFSIFRWQECLYSNTGPSQASSHFQVLLLSHHFNIVITLCLSISNCLLPQAWQAKIFYSFSPLTSTT